MTARMRPALLLGNEIEGILAVQMLGTHNVTVSMLHRARTTDRADFLAIVRRGAGNGHATGGGGSLWPNGNRGTSRNKRQQ